jgi:hypothetical protein
MIKLALHVKVLLNRRKTVHIGRISALKKLTLYPIPHPLSPSPGGEGEKVGRLEFGIWNLIL